MEERDNMRELLRQAFQKKLPSMIVVKWNDAREVWEFSGHLRGRIVTVSDDKEAAIVVQHLADGYRSGKFSWQNN